MSHPREIDLSENLKNTFGCYEFENLACKIIEYLKVDELQHIPANSSLSYTPPGIGWEKRFTLEDLGVNPTLFAMFCAAGWVKNYWFPKGSFVVSEEFIKRVESRWLKAANKLV